MPLAGHVQGVVRQPALVFRPEVGHRAGIALPAPLIGLAKKGKAALVDLSVVHVARVAAPVGGGALGGRQQPVIHQHIRVDKIGVAGVGGKALVGGVAIAGGTQGEHLPVGLAGVFQEIGEIIGRLAQGTDAIGGGQGGYRH